MFNTLDGGTKEVKITSKIWQRIGLPQVFSSTKCNNHTLYVFVHSTKRTQHNCQIHSEFYHIFVESTVHLHCIF